MANEKDPTKKKPAADLAVLDPTVGALSFGAGEGGVEGTFQEVELSELWFKNEPGAALCFVPLERSDDVKHHFESKFPGDKSPTYVWVGVITQESDCQVGGEPRKGMPGELVKVIESPRLKKQFGEAARDVGCIRLTAIDKVPVTSKKYGDVLAWDYRLEKFAVGDPVKQQKMREKAEEFRAQAKDMVPVP